MNSALRILTYSEYDVRIQLFGSKPSFNPAGPMRFLANLRIQLSGPLSYIPTNLLD